MTVDQTAAWIRDLSVCNGWDEANQYSQNFHQNGISGQLLKKITMSSLRFELCVLNHGHRVVIKSEIERLYPDVLREVSKEEK